MDLIVAGVFIVVLGIIFGAYWLLVVVPEQRQSGAVRKRLKSGRARIAKADIGKDAEAIGGMGAVDAALERWTGIAEPLRETVERSGLRLTPGGLVLMSAVSALVVFVVVRVATSSTLVAVGLAAVAGAVRRPR